MGGDKAPVAYRPKHEKAVDTATFGLMGSNQAQDQAVYNTASTGYNDAYQKILNNPYNASAQAGVDKAAATYGAQGDTNLGYQKTLEGYAPAIEQAGFDPLSANYNFGLTQAQDAQKVSNAQSGIAGSPFGAGTVTDAGNMYTMNYNAEKQQRMQSAIQALSALFGDASTFGARGAADQGVAATLPQAHYNETQMGIMSALDSLVNGLNAAGGPLHTDVKQGLDYINTGTAATQAADQAVAQNNSQGGIMGALGSLLGGGLLSGGSAGGGGGGLLGSLLGQTGGAAGLGQQGLNALMLAGAA